MLIPPLTRWVRPRLALLALGLTLPFGAVLLGQAGQETVARTPAAVAATGEAAPVWARRVEAMERSGVLRLRSSVADTMIEGRVHDRFDQYAGEARIYGGQLVRQRSGDGVESVFGTIYPEDLGISLRPTLSAEDAVARATALAGNPPMGGRAPELVVLPRDGAFTLAWLVDVRAGHDFVSLFLDARTGEERWRLSHLRHQTAVGSGNGVLGDRKKLATRQVTGSFLADDTLRPPSLITYDLRGNHDRALDILDGLFPAAQSDIASDTDNFWTDGAVVDGHNYVGSTYDYFFARFGRRGLDDRNRPIRGLVNPARPGDVLDLFDELEFFFSNAGWCDTCGSDRQGYMYFGVGLPSNFTLGGQRIANLAGAFDVVAHELSHAVTSYSSDLIYESESGALNESFSDVMAVGAEFYLRASGRSDRAGDYVIAEDVFTPGRAGAPTGIRSLENPAAFGDPDHYSRRYTGSEDNGGVHINSGIPNHAFYLAIEGGTNRTSGLAVQGVGAANREQIERVFYRGFTTYLTQRATFAQARQATLRAASDLYGDSSAAFRAVSQAWTAVGVN